jgi:hypothetical protein
MCASLVLWYPPVGLAVTHNPVCSCQMSS